MKEVGAQVDMAKEVRYGQGWLELDVSQGSQQEDSPAPSFSGDPYVQDHGAYGTDRPYYPEMVSTEKPIETGQTYPEFYVQLVNVDGDVHYEVKKGVVLYQNIGGSVGVGASVLSYEVPELNGTAIDTVPAPTELAAEGKVFINVKTSTKGVIQVTPTVELVGTASLPKTSTHHRPSDPLNVGVDGDYWFEIAEITTVDGELKIDSRVTGNRNIPNQLIQGINVGTGAEVYKQYQDGALDYHEFRKADGRGTYSGDTPDAGTTEQIDVVEDGDTIRVIGNGKKGSLAIDGGSPGLAWNDGLITTSGDVDLSSSGGQTHPWEVTDAGSGSVDIAAGFILGYYLDYGAASPDTPPASPGLAGIGDWVCGPAGSYAGGTVAIAGTKYLYALLDRNFTGTTGGSNEYAEGYDESDVNVLVELYDELEPTFLDTATVDTPSSDAPDTYSPASGKVAVCIAKVVNDGANNLTITQYVTHNPTLFLPMVNVLAVAPI